MAGGALLLLEERTEICRRVGLGESIREIGRALGRAPSTICRELARNGGREGYRPFKAARRAKQQAKRPKQRRLDGDVDLAAVVVARLLRWWSPRQISRRLRRDHAGDPRWWVSEETIYRWLYVQARSGLRPELARALRSGRVRRRSSQHGKGHGQLNDMVLISERPAEAADRAVPGHWEGDLVQGGRDSAVATLVERSSRYLIVVPLPEGRTADKVRDALIDAIKTLPDHLRRSLTWDQGKEMARHVELKIAADIDIYSGIPPERGGIIYEEW